MSKEKPSINILKSVEQIKIDYSKVIKGEMEEEELKNNHSKFIEMYPTIYSKIKDDKLDMDIFKLMLSKLDGIHNGNQTEYQASVDIGTKLRDQLIIPDMKKKGMNVDINNNILGLDEKEAKKKLDQMFKL